MTYFVPKYPTSGENASYFRPPIVFDTELLDIEWVWRFSDDAVFSPWPEVYMEEDGVRVTPNIRPTINEYVFKWTSTPGHHLAKPVVLGLIGVDVLAKPFVVNNTGAPLAVQRPWTATLRFDHKYHSHSNVAAQLNFPPVPPKVYPLKPRPIETYNTRLTKDQLWGYYNQINIDTRFMRMPALTGHGDWTVEAVQKYFYADAVMGADPPVVKTPPYPLYDGPRGVGTTGPVYKIVIRRGRKGEYRSDTIGRLYFKSPAGAITTLAGWRIKPGETHVHNGVKSVHYLSSFLGTTNAQQKAKQAEHVAFADSKWETVGDWSQVPGAKGFIEPWGFAVASRRADGSIDRRDGHEFWVCDTLHHRIVFVDHWTAHSVANYEKAHFPPAGYIPPEAPTGQTTLYPFLTTADGLPSALLNEPWDADIGPDGKLYWSNFAGNSICRANLDGSNPEVVFQGQMLTNQQLGFTTRLLGMVKQTHVDANRALYLRDGPIGTASCTRPQAVAFDSEGNLVWAERYTYALRKIKKAALLGQEPINVSTVGLVPKIEAGSTSAASRDIAMTIDYEGTCGPVDDVFVNIWHNSDFRFDKDGNYVGRWSWSGADPLPNGQLIDCDVGGYSWGCGVGDGLLVNDGNAGGFQNINIVKRRPDDPTIDRAKWERGILQYESLSGMWLTHGPVGMGRMGFPNFEELGALSDTALDAYLASQGIADIEALRYVIRSCTLHFDYSAQPPGDTLPPSNPSNPLDVTLDYAMGMYNILLRGTAPVNQVPELNDIAEARVYLDGNMTVVPTTPGSQFDVTLQHPGPGPITVLHSFADAAGNESTKFMQTVVLPDVSAPMAPVEPLQLISVVWAA